MAISIERFRVNVRILYVQHDAATLPPLAHESSGGSADQRRRAERRTIELSSRQCMDD